MNERELYALAKEILTDTQWRRLHLHHWEGFSISDLATAERVSEQAIRSCIKGAERALLKARDKRERKAA